jgi:hypothetical protein
MCFSTTHVRAGPEAPIYYDHFTTGPLRGNVVARNKAGAYAGGVTIWEGSAPSVESNTIVYNEAPLGSAGLYVTRGSHVDMLRTIVAFNTNGGVGIGLNSSVQPTCSDVYGNAIANWDGMPDPTGTNGNIALDPLFCDPAHDVYTLATTSPCAAAHSPTSCGLIGARDVAVRSHAQPAGDMGRVQGAVPLIEHPWRLGDSARVATVFSPA